jgi:ribose transport system substrate-binding protein
MRKALVHLNRALARVIPLQFGITRSLWRFMAKHPFRNSILVAGGVLIAVSLGISLWIRSNGGPSVPTIAFIPQAPDAMRAEVEHAGAKAAAEKLKCHLYWNAPTSENDSAGQVSLIDRVVRARYQGLVLAPNHPLAILTPLRRALAAGVPVVVVSAPLDLPANGKLGYIVNDDEKMGELAAAEIGRLLNGEGSVALAGVGRYAPGVAARARGAERLLASRFPNIQVVTRVSGAYNATRAEELAIDVMDSYPELNAFLSLTAVSTRAVHAAIKGRSAQSAVRIVGCEQDSDLIGYVGTGEISAIVAEDTYRMGHAAVELITAAWSGTPIPAQSVVAPLLITRQNLNTAEVNRFVSFPK